jgi:hypothetical protein
MENTLKKLRSECNQFKSLFNLRDKQCNEQRKKLIKLSTKYDNCREACEYQKKNRCVFQK